jgi:rare lipoprotein A (peptidoglycan hydrolase)
VNRSSSSIFLVTVAVSAASLARANAQEVWSPAYGTFSGVDVSRSPSVGRKREVTAFVSTGWRTVIVPAPAEVPTATVSARRTASLEALKPSPRPLTGYAHELGGIASYYWQDQMTSSGERFDRRALTAAHKTLPIGTKVRVTNLSNGQSTVVRINDRGPFKSGRVIDLSEAAAEQISMTRLGLVRVAIEVVR